MPCDADLVGLDNDGANQLNGEEAEWCDVQRRRALTRGRAWCAPG
jgi:hypothetical protein